MRSFDETDEDDRKDLAEQNMKPWQLALVKMNPSYVFWGPHEDYMCNKNAGWGAPVFLDSWADFKWELNELNELVNFYFEVSRDAEECGCNSGYGRDSSWVSESFYNHSSPFDRDFPDAETMNRYGAEFEEFCERMVYKIAWNDDLTQDEVDELVKENRLKAGVTAEEVNKAQSEHGKGLWMTHDAINRHILIEHRCKRFGIETSCKRCDGRAYVYTTKEPKVSLVLWFIHPRKGASRAVEIKNIQETDVPAALSYLSRAAERNAERFSKILQSVQKTV